VFGNRAIANVALQSQVGQARFHGAFSGSVWPWWRGGVALGWFGPLFWPYAYYDLFDSAVSLGLADDFADGIITKRIVERAKAGERNPDLLCQGALEELRGHLYGD
jgi:hypothetical protein